MLQNITITLKQTNRKVKAITFSLKYILSNSDTKRLKVGSIISTNQSQWIVTGLEIGNSLIVYVKSL